VCVCVCVCVYVCVCVCVCAYIYIYIMDTCPTTTAQGTRVICLARARDLLPPPLPSLPPL